MSQWESNPRPQCTSGQEQRLRSRSHCGRLVVGMTSVSFRDPQICCRLNLAARTELSPREMFHCYYIGNIPHFSFYTDN